MNATRSKPIDPSTPSPPSGMKYDRIAVLILLIGIAATVAAYRKSFHSPFTLDDSSALFQTPAIRSPWTAWQGTASRRFVNLTFALNYYFDGYRVTGYHAVNFGIHVAGGLVLFGLIRRSLNASGIPSDLSRRGARIAAAISVIWLIHPLQTQSVTYVVQRYESLMGGLLIGSIYCLSRTATSPRPWIWNIGCLVAGWLSVESKESAIVLPLIAIAYDRTFMSTTWRELCRRRGLVHLGLAATSAYLLLRSRAAFDTSTPVTAGFGATSSTPWQYLSTQPGVILHYLRISLWPDVLCIDYRWPIAREWLTIVAPGLVVLGLFVASTWGTFRGSRVGFVGITFFLLLAVTSSIIPIDDIAVEHRMYLPLACVAILAVLAACEGAKALTRSEKWRRVLLGSLLLAVTVSLAARTYVRNLDYAEPLRLWTKALDVNPGNARAHCYVGRLLGERGDFKEAEHHLLTALELSPRSSFARAQLGLLATHKNDIPMAIHWYEEALEVRPKFVKVMILIGDLHRKEGRSEIAMKWYRQATEAQTDNAEAWRNLGRLLMESGERVAAEKALRMATKLNPRDEVSLGRLAWLLATDPESAPSACRESLEIASTLSRRRDYGALQILAAAQACCGDFDQALATAQLAAELARSVGDARRVELLLSHMDSYRKKRRVDAHQFSPPAPGPRHTLPVEVNESAAVQPPNDCRVPHESGIVARHHDRQA